MIESTIDFTHQNPAYSLGSNESIIGRMQASREPCRRHRPEILVQNSLGSRGFHRLGGLQLQIASSDLGNFDLL